MKVLKFIGLTLVTIIALYLIIAAVSSKDVVIERTTEYTQSPEEVFAAVNDFNQYGKWNAWFMMDPNVEYEITGTGKNIGDVWSWKSSMPEVGVGKMTHVSAEPGKAILNDMTFEGMDAASQDVWTFEETENGGTAVTWKAEMEAPFMARPFFGTMMEAMIGPLFDKSLSTLEEHLNNMEWAGFTQEKAGPFNYIYIQENIPVTEIGEAYGKNIAELFAFLGKNGIEPAGAPMSIYHSWGDSTKFDVAIPVADEVKVKGNIMQGEIAEGNAVTYMHIGSYEASEAVHYKMDDYLKKMELTHISPVVEVYYNNPSDTPAEELETKIIYFIQ